jgi:uncharacterized membrane protein HdeD (DUF308 family)
MDHKEVPMLESLSLFAQTQVNLSGIIALVAGVLILAIPGLLRWIVGVYLILVGLIQLFDIAL